MSLPTKSVVILDLDNTLWDWVGIWHATFTAMLDELVRISGVPAADLKPAIREIHQRRGTTEYAFLIEELTLLHEACQGRPVMEVYAPAVKAFRKARMETLRTYPKVMETLWALRDRGCTLVAYTESSEFYTAYRVRKLCLDGLLHYLYSPADHGIPEGVSLEDVRRYPDEHYEFVRTEHRFTPIGEFKPNPHILSSILDDVGARPDQAVYVGDSLMKDISMAQDAQVTDVYAKYGETRASQAYELLREVTHWTPEDVEWERRIDQRGEVVPSLTLQSGLWELFDHFRFVEHRNRPVAHVPSAP